MKEKILILGSADTGKIAIHLAQKMNITVVSADQANNAFNNMPTFEIKRNPIFPDIFFDPKELFFNAQKHKATCLKNRKKRKKKRGRK